MFSEMLASLGAGKLPDPVALRGRFDMAVTKKQGVHRLPAAFWVEDPKINPRVDHLFWAALLIGDRLRIDHALALVAAELQERNKGPSSFSGERLAELAGDLIRRLFAELSDPSLCGAVRERLEPVVPEWLGSMNGCGA